MGALHPKTRDPGSLLLGWKDFARPVQQAWFLAQQVLQKGMCGMQQGLRGHLTGRELMPGGTADLTALGDGSGSSRIPHLGRTCSSRQTSTSVEKRLVRGASPFRP